MRLVHFETLDGRTHFGIQRVDTVHSFEQATAALALEHYLGDPLTTADVITELLGEGVEDWPADQVRFLPAAQPPVILDCSVSPAHLRTSARVLFRRSLPAGVGLALGALAGAVVDRSTPRSGDNRRVPYYKANPASVSGDGDTIPWPDYSGYVDIEPELAFVTGHVPKGAESAECVDAIRGYLIFNDASARDVQFAEMMLAGLATSKDFDGGNGLGPCLVTPDEICDPLALGCTVEFSSDRAPWIGSTSCYTLAPHEVLASLTRRQSIVAGTVIGMGTIAGCCGLDRDEWIEPDEEFAISIEGLGTLRQRFSAPVVAPKSAWGLRRVELAAHTDPKRDAACDRLTQG